MGGDSLEGAVKGHKELKGIENRRLHGVRGLVLTCPLKATPPRRILEAWGLEPRCSGSKRELEVRRETRFCPGPAAEEEQEGRPAVSGGCV